VKFFCETTLPHQGFYQPKNFKWRRSGFSIKLTALQNHGLTNLQDHG